MQPIDPIKLNQSLTVLEQSLGKAEYHDTSITVRIVGEFSAGKTRLLRELLTGLAPDRLLPVSRLARETLVPLEVTYGERVGLWQIQRESDFDTEPQHIREWDHFPTREELKAANGDLSGQRLRLTIPKTELLLNRNPTSEEQSNSLHRVYLIDTPGWNAGEILPDTFFGDDIMASVYVVAASRIDAADNHQELVRFLEELYDQSTFVDRENLMVYVTHWRIDANEQPSTRPWQQAFEDRIMQAADVAGFDDTLLQPVHYLDFDRMDASAKRQFQIEFWNRLRQGMTDAQPKPMSIQDQIDQWDIYPQLLALSDQVSQGRRFLQGFADQDLTPGLNMTRLNVYPQASWAERIQKAMTTALPALDCLTTPVSMSPLAEGHPLAGWWNNVLSPRLIAGFNALRQCCLALIDAANQVTETDDDLNQALKAAVWPIYLETADQFRWCDSLFPSALQAAMNNRVKLCRIVATLLAITIGQAEIEQFLKNSVRIKEKQHDAKP